MEMLWRSGTFRLRDVQGHCGGRSTTLIQVCGLSLPQGGDGTDNEWKQEEEGNGRKPERC